MTYSASQTGVSILGGFRAVKSERKVRFGQTWWQSKGLMEYYQLQLFKRQSRPFIKPQSPQSSKIKQCYVLAAITVLIILPAVGEFFLNPLFAAKRQKDQLRISIHGLKQINKIYALRDELLIVGLLLHQAFFAKFRK